MVAGIVALSRPEHLRLTDLQVYTGAIDSLRNGAGLYDFARNGNAPFTYPPFAALLMLPLAWLPTWLLHVAWTAGTALSAIGLALLFNRRAAPLIALALMLSAPVSSNFKYGQVSILLALLVATDVLALRHSRHQGVLIGIAAAVKLTPLIFIPMLWLTGRRRAAGIATATFLASGTLAAYLLPAESWRYWTTEVQDVSRLGFITSAGNQSLNGALLRLDAPHRELLATLLAGTIAAIALWSTTKLRNPQAHTARTRHPQMWLPKSRDPQTWPPKIRDPHMWLPEIRDPHTALVITGAASVVLSPVSWTHHQVWLVFAAFLPLAPSLRIATLTIMLLPMTAIDWWPFQESRLLLAITLALLLHTLLTRRPHPSAPHSSPADLTPRPHTPHSPTSLRLGTLQRRRTS
ncbi:glycosyltransferase 87 family protein [Actinoplanes sp. GCM10030250]|uniref:glycosyltransferase 87 family protein n=1 Tax=Actinoplanes sp. GCM10030250 TaxID=3273376 RepID=UPI00361814A3